MFYDQKWLDMKQALHTLSPLPYFVLEIIIKEVTSVGKNMQQFNYEVMWIRWEENRWMREKKIKKSGEEHTWVHQKASPR